MPRWFLKHDWGCILKFSHTKFTKNILSTGLKDYGEGRLKVLISSEVQAIIELLAQVPQDQDIEEAKQLMKSLTAVHIENTITLLKACNYIKAKRLFLLLADLCGHAWIKKIVIKDLNLGIGPRNLYPGGKYNNQYQITVPESLYLEEGYEHK